VLALTDGKGRQGRSGLPSWPLHLSVLPLFKGPVWRASKWIARRNKFDRDFVHECLVPARALVHACLFSSFMRKLNECLVPA
jgi:hypothetical protein